MGTEKKKFVVGMSGGVDSSVAAYLLKRQGYEVMGVTMRFWQENQGEAEGERAFADAKKVADRIGIPFYAMDFKEEFQCSVVDYFVEEYICGRTPNPCVACNRYVKWEALFKISA